MRLRFKFPVFWICVALVIAVVVHLSYVLFTPTRAMDAKFDRTVAKSGINALAVLSPAEARSLTGLSAVGSMVGGNPGGVPHQEPLGHTGFGQPTRHPAAESTGGAGDGEV